MAKLNKILEDINREIPRKMFDLTNDLFPVIRAFTISSRMNLRRKMRLELENAGAITTRENSSESLKDAAYSLEIGLINSGYVVGAYLLINFFKNY